MAIALFGVVVIALLLVGVYLVGLLVWQVFGMTWITWIVVSGIRRQRAALAREIAGLSAEQIRERLLASTYFADDLRSQPPIEAFLSRIARRDEQALRTEYSRGRLYRMFCRCETAAGRRGRPEAVDSIEELYPLLDALAERARLGKK